MGSGRLPCVIFPISIFLTSFVLFAQCQEFEQTVALDPNDRVQLSWSVDLETSSVTFQVKVNTLGWVGLGFSPSGSMKGADIVVGWIEDGEVHFSDRHAEKNGLPLVDDSQDYELLDAFEDEESTTLTFRRLIDTCDIDKDVLIDHNTIKVIYAFGEEDPEGEDPYYHEGNRGVKSLLLLDPPFGEIQLDESVKQIEFRSPNVTLRSDTQTTYWCSLHRGPVLETKHHYIGNEAIVVKGNENYVHHYAVYECDLNEEGDEELFLETLDQYPNGFHCHHSEAPRAFRKCEFIRTVWAVGGYGDRYPEEAGYPIPTSDKGPVYYKLEVHYDNPNLDDGVVDNSGVRWYYTDKLRQYDMDILLVGMPAFYAQLIPPGLDEFVSIGHASSLCTEKYFPEEGINVFAVLHHAHLAGRRIRTRLFSPDKEEPWLLADDNYDFNYQQTRLLDERRKIYPGDHITTECFLSSKHTADAIIGGLTTADEMCGSFILYYPAVPVNFAGSNPPVEYIHEVFGFYNVSRDVNDTFEFYVGDQTMHEYLRSFDWENFDYEAYQHNVRYGAQDGKCFANDWSVIVGLEIFYPDVPEYEPPPRDC